MDKLSLDVPTALLKRHYGGNLGNINVIWKINRDDKILETKMAKATLAVTESLPKYHSRQMRKDFIRQYGSVADASKGVLLDIYKNVTGITIIFSLLLQFLMKSVLLIYLIRGIV